MLVKISHEDAKQYPVEYIGVLGAARSSRSKYKNTPPDEMQWKIVWSVAVGRAHNVSGAGGQVSAHLQASVGKSKGWQCHFSGGCVPSHIVDFYARIEEMKQRQKQTLKREVDQRKKDCPVMTVYGSEKSDEKLVIDGYESCSDGVKKVLCLDDTGMEFIYKIEGDVARWGGCLHGFAGMILKTTWPGQVWEYRRKKFRKLTRQELYDLVDGKRFRFAAP